VNGELVWFVDRDFHTTVGALRADEPLDLLETNEWGLARAHVRALLGKSTAFELEWNQRAFSCHVRPLYGEQEWIVGSFGVAIELHGHRREGAASDPHAEGADRVGRTSVAGTSVAVCDVAPRVARRMRAFSRPGTPQTFDVVEHLRRMLPRIERLLPDSVSVAADLANDAVPVRFDPARLTQIVIGLISNARDAMPTGGTLQIRVEQRPSAAQIVITDDGVGMSHEDVARAFEPHYTTKPGHAGLGLATARVLLAADGGALRLESALGSGTTVAIVLPAADAATT
jgi:Histidine kinase-, DNA gyrase B-, and HSP90-like ATPase